MSKKAAAEKAQAATTPPSAPAAGEGPSSPEPNEAAAVPTDEGAPAAAPAEPARDYRELYEQANDRWLRARAELDNYRRRVQREFAEIRHQAMVQTVAEFLTVGDHLSRALEHAPAATDEAPLRQGLELIHGEFGRALSKLGVSRVETVGKPFDPTCHEAIAQEASEAVPAGVIVREWKAGFMLGERLLRPATVSVSAGPAASVVEGTAAAGVPTAPSGAAEADKV